MSTYNKASLVLIPSGSKTSKIYSQKPTNGDGDFSFTRSTSATRVNQSGLIEKETQNLLLQSNNFNESIWSKLDGVSITGQTATDPYGVLNNAWVINFNGNNSARLEQNIPSPSGLKVMSLWVRTQSGTQDFRLAFRGSYQQTFTATTQWQRFEHFDEYSVTQYPRINCSDLSTLEIYGFQVEQGLVARDYIETTTSAVYGGITDNVPRIDYTDATCPSLLLEPTRTNVVLASEYPHSSGVSGIPFARGGANLTYNYGISPEGLQNSTLVTGTNGNVGIQVSFYNSDVNVDWSYSFYIKGIAGETFHLRYEITPYVLNSQELITFTGDWQRIERTISYDGSVHTIKQWYITFLQQSTATQFEIYGLQAESNASFPTSYIPTYGTSVSRNIELPNYLDITNLTGSTFTIFLDYKDAIRGGSTGNWMYLFNTSNQLLTYVYSGTLMLHSTSGENYTPFTFGDGKVAFVYDGTNVKYFLNGTLVKTVTASTRWNLGAENYWLYSPYNNSQSTIKYNSFIILSESITDQEAINLTTT